MRVSSALPADDPSSVVDTEGLEELDELEELEAGITRVGPLD